MNQQRIVELWDKANSRYYQSESDQPLPQFIFAELIVRECIGCCEEVADINKTYIEEKFVDPEFGPKECIEVIKKHFGVEE